MRTLISSCLVRCRRFSFHLLLSLVMAGSALAMQGQPDVTKFLFEGLDYKKNFSHDLLLEEVIRKDPRFRAVLEREGIEVPGGGVPAVLSDLSEGEDEEDPVLLGPLHDVEEGVTSDDLNAALVQRFRTLKSRSMWLSLGRPAFTLALDVMAFGGGMQTLSYVMPDGFAFAAGIAGFVMLEKFSQKFSMGFDLLWYLRIVPLGDPLMDLEDTYARKKRFLLPAIQEKIERVFQDARKDDQMGTKKEYLGRILRLPVQSQKPTPDFPKLENILSGYVDEAGNSIRTPILRAVAGHMARFTEKVQPNKIPKTILYLEGPPGLGKTKLVEDLAEAMGLELISLQLSDERLKSTSDMPGTLLSSLFNRPRNSVLFLDEVDRVANQEGSSQLNTLLPFLNPSAQLIFDPYVGESLDISHYFLVMAGNHTLEDAALLDRCEVVHVNRMIPAFKESNIRQNMLPLLMRSEDPELGLTLDDLPYELREEVDQAIAKNDEAGFRTIQKQLQGLFNGQRVSKLKWE